MKRTLLVALVCALTLGATASVASATARPRSHSQGVTTKASGLDKLYLRSSIQTDLAEIGAGKLALTKSHNQQVRRIASRFITDHTRLLTSARTLATKLDVAAPREPSPTQQLTAQVLSTLSGKVFDHWYSASQVAGHQEAIQLTQGEIAAGTNATVRQAAKMARPMLRAHLRLAEAALRASS